MAGERYSYDSADRHVSTTAGATTVDYGRDATGRVVQRSATGESTVRYIYTGGGDTPGVVADGSGNVTERDLVLPGGVVVTRRAGGEVWSYPNIHGDVAAACDQTGAKVGASYVYDPFGNNVSSGAVLPDNSAGSFDYGWLGSHQRGLEHRSGLNPTVEMGARPYNPRLGRFLQVDPVPGGSANNYDYTGQDPVNAFDLDGNFCWGHHCLRGTEVDGAPHAGIPNGVA